MHRKRYEWRCPELTERQRIADAEELSLFGAGDAGVGAEAVVVVEARFGRPGRDGVAAHVAEFAREADDFFAGTGIPRRHGAARAGIAAFECNLAYFESHDVIFVGTEKLVLPKRGNAADFERGAEAFARFV